MAIIPRGFGGAMSGKFGITCLNAPQVIAKFASYGDKSTSLVMIAIKRSLIMVEAEAIRLVAGNIYWKNPIDTRRMINSITHQIISFSYTKIEGRVGTNVYYAIYVHEGTKHMSVGAARSGSIIFNLGKRPFLTDALHNKTPEIVASVKAAYRKEIFS